MKTLSAFALVFLSAGIFNSLSAQSLQIVGESAMTVKKETKIIADVQATVRNISSQPIKIHVLRENVSLVPGHNTYFCWIKCYDSSVYHSPLPDEQALTLAPGDSTDVFHGYVNPKTYDANDRPTGTVDGKSIIKYHFYNEDNETDEVVLTITFLMGNVSSVEVDYPTASKAPSATPNPADDMTHITYAAPADFQFGTVTIVDALGKNCGSVPAGQSTARIQTSHLPAGVYSYAVTSERGLIVARGQFVVAR